MTEFQKYIQKYLDLNPSGSLPENLKSSGELTLQTYNKLTEEQSGFAYAEGKWTLKEVLQHLIDAERIFTYRALRFSRNDQTELPGWNEEDYAKHYFLEKTSVENLIKEFQILRESTVIFFKNLDDEQLSRTGIANGNEISVEKIGKLIAGHNFHHLNVINERYLPNLK